MTDHRREILQDQPTRDIGPFTLELGEIVSDTAAHVDEKGIVLRDIRAIDELLMHREKTNVHPAGTAKTVDGHVVVELLCSEGVPFCNLEEMEVGVEA